MSILETVQISDGTMTADVIAHGAVLAGLWLPGIDHSLTLGLPSLAAYQADNAHIGAIAGPVAGRISDARFVIDGTESRTTANDGPNTLHGGARGFGRRPWKIVEHDDASVCLALEWPDGAEGFSGPIEAKCRYTITDRVLRIVLEATTARPTLCNLAQHSYFNLSGVGRIDDHRLEIASGDMTPLGDDLLPTGTVEPCPPDQNFTKSQVIGDRLLDCHYVLARNRRTPTFAALLSAENVSMTVVTTEPGLVVYTADKLDSHPHGPRAGICLEPQCWPDAINHSGFPTTILRPGETYRQETALQFRVN